MTTPLRKRLARELVLDEVPFKVVLSPDGVQIMRKGHRKGPLVGWDSILRLSEANQDNPRPSPPAGETDLPRAIAAEVASEVAAAWAALTRAGEKLGSVADLPPELKLQMEPDPVYGAREERSDWFIEPLLTPAELGSVLRISTAAVARLPIRWISIAGERRYRQSEVRQYLMREERDNTHGRW